jgi:hypothetical protein
MMFAHDVRSAGITGGIVDHFVESKGVSCRPHSGLHSESDPLPVLQLDAIDKAKAKHEAKKKAEAALANSGDYN